MKYVLRMFSYACKHVVHYVICQQKIANALTSHHALIPLYFEKAGHFNGDTDTDL